MSKPAKLLVSGGVRTVASTVDHPKLHIFPPSFNSGKAVLSMCISSLDDSVETHKYFILSDNYTIEYARLNENMTVPTLEVDDKVITDSLDLGLYLCDKHPGKGDQLAASQGKLEEVKAFARSMAEWDEYQLTYGNMKASDSDMANEIRIINLKKELSNILGDRTSTFGCAPSKPFKDKDRLVSTYIEKISGIQNMKYAISGVSEERKKEELDKNWKLLMQLCKNANGLREGNGGNFLFGSELTTADCFFLPVFRLCEMQYPDLLTKLYEQFPSLQAYWSDAKRHPALNRGFLFSKASLAAFVVSRGAPRFILGYKTGLVKAPTLPEEIEKQIQARVAELRLATRP